MIALLQRFSGAFFPYSSMAEWLKGGLHIAQMFFVVLLCLIAQRAGAQDTPLGDKQNGAIGNITLLARMHEQGPIIQSGLVWRIFPQISERDDIGEALIEIEGGIVKFELPFGRYLIHASYGFAGIVKPVEINALRHRMALNLDAGGVRFGAEFAAKDDGLAPIDPDRLQFHIFSSQFDRNGERIPIARNIKPGIVVPLDSGFYHMASHYGAVNAVVNADIGVQAGKLTEIKFIHNAARITLKLVNDPKGEAIANTRWTIFTPGGDSVIEMDGPFPEFILAAGIYEVVARSGGRIYSKNFTVQSGHHQEIELVTRLTYRPAASQLPSS